MRLLPLPEPKKWVPSRHLITLSLWHTWLQPRAICRCLYFFFQLQSIPGENYPGQEMHSISCWLYSEWTNPHNRTTIWFRRRWALGRIVHVKRSVVQDGKEWCQQQFSNNRMGAALINYRTPRACERANESIKWAACGTGKSSEKSSYRNRGSDILKSTTDHWENRSECAA